MYDESRRISLRGHGGLGAITLPSWATNIFGGSETPAVTSATKAANTAKDIIDIAQQASSAYKDVKSAVTNSGGQVIYNPGAQPQLEQYKFSLSNWIRANKGLAIGLGVGATAVVGGTIYLIVRKRKKKNAAK